MPKKTVDRRVQRTKAALQQALLSLLRKRRYDRISVQDICDAANVGRSTFYGHFTSKDELKRSGLDHLRDALLDRQRTALSQSSHGHGHLAFGPALFEHAREHRDLYKALAGTRGSTVALAGIRHILSELVSNELQATARRNNLQVTPQEIVIQYIVGAYMNVLTWWLDTGAQLSPARIDEMLRRLATQGIVSPRE